MKQNQMKRGIYSGGNEPPRHKDVCPSCGYYPVANSGEHKNDCFFVLQQQGLLPKNHPCALKED
jgi:hypothetical protein